MPPTTETDIQFSERFAWLPVRSNFNKKRIWFKKYWQGEIFHDAMGRPPIKESSWKLIYSQNEYVMYLLRKDHIDVQGEWIPKYPKTPSYMPW